MRFTRRTAGYALVAAVALLATQTSWAKKRSFSVLEGAPEPAAPPPPMPGDELGTPHTNNTAGLRLDIRPGRVLPLGTPVQLEVSTARAGYLILVDINAEHEAAQIYPRLSSPLALKPGVTNLLSPGETISIPNLRNPMARFELKADRPTGRGVIVALLSERPIKTVVLPQRPLPVTAAQAAVDYLDKTVRSSSMTTKERSDASPAGDWSLAAVEYVIK